MTAPSDIVGMKNIQTNYRAIFFRHASKRLFREKGCRFLYLFPTEDSRLKAWSGRRREMNVGRRQPILFEKSCC